MRVWTEATFGTAIEDDREGQDQVLWLSARGEVRKTRVASVLDGVDRAGTRVGRLTAVICVGFLVCGALPNSALAPVSSAKAAGERFKLQPVWPAGLEQLAAPTPGGRDVRAPDRTLSAVTPVAPIGAAEEVTAASTQLLDSASALKPASEEMQHPSVDGTREEAEEFLRFGSRELPRRLVATIVRAANATDVDPIYLMALADKESSFRTQVKASTSSAEGLFQFIERTWLDTVKTFGARHGLAAEADLVTTANSKPSIAVDAERARILGLRRDPYIAAVMAAEMLRRDAAEIGFRIGRQLSPTEMYLAHFLGLEDAARFIEMRAAKRAQSATAAFPAAARANAAIFFERGRRGRRKGLTVPEVYAKIDGMIDSRIDLFGPVRRYAAADSNS